MLQMTLGMEYLQGQGVVHRDLKSPNILVSPSPYPELRSLGFAAVKVTNFGLAKVEVFGPSRAEPNPKNPNFRPKKNLGQKIFTKKSKLKF